MRSPEVIADPSSVFPFGLFQFPHFQDHKSWLMTEICTVVPADDESKKSVHIFGDTESGPKVMLGN